MSIRLTEAERITAVETRLSSLEEKVERIETKIDDLIAIKNKGAGAFWLASILFGTSLFGVFSMFLSWMKN